jgi:hypothetical protein
VRRGGARRPLVLGMLESLGRVAMLAALCGSVAGGCDRLLLQLAGAASVVVVVFFAHYVGW